MSQLSLHGRVEEEEEEEEEGSFLPDFYRPSERHKVMNERAKKSPVNP